MITKLIDFLNSCNPEELVCALDELYEEAVKRGEDSELFKEARRIYWEFYWRHLKRYKGERPFFDIFMEIDGKVVELPKTKENIEKVINEGIIMGFAIPGFIPEEVKRTTIRVYRELFKKMIGRFIDLVR